MKLTPLQSSFGVSICSHAVAFGLFLSVGKTPHPATGDHNATELLVSMVAAPAEIVAPATLPVVEVQARVEPQATPIAAPRVVEEEEVQVFPDPIALPQLVTTEIDQPPAAKVTDTNPVEIHANATPQASVRGDGSSPQPGIDMATTEPSPGVRAQPKYLKNPEPPYPAQARRRGQEGLVILEVRVTRQGRASEISVKQSSGFPLLDDAAMKSVREWAAKVGTVPVESRIEVPVRFRLAR